jgi:hypothetical protein
VQGHQGALGVAEAVEDEVAHRPARAARRQPGLLVAEGTYDGCEGLVRGAYCVERGRFVVRMDSHGTSLGRCLGESCVYRPDG